MKLAALDPGHVRSALVVMDGDRVEHAEMLENGRMLTSLWAVRRETPDMRLVIEQIESFGMAVGREVFETVFWCGRFAEFWGIDRVERFPRRLVKTTLCRTSRATDANVRQALIDHYGPGKEIAIGTKSKPRPLYGIKADLWAALAVGFTFPRYQQEQREKGIAAMEVERC